MRAVVCRRAELGVQDLPDPTRAKGQVLLEVTRSPVTARGSSTRHPASIETSVLPLRLAYRRAKGRGEVTIDPTDRLELPEKPMRGATRGPPTRSICTTCSRRRPTTTAPRGPCSS